jgi:hypothetical protein
MLATGELLCCKMLYSSFTKDFEEIARSEIQPWCNINDDGIQNLKANSNVVDKYYPDGPYYSYKDVVLCCLH